jgi:hypothetical protein
MVMGRNQGTIRRQPEQQTTAWSLAGYRSLEDVILSAAKILWLTLSWQRASQLGTKNYLVGSFVK